MRIPASLGLTAAAIVTSTPALAGSGTVTIEIPRIDTYPYRKPYVAAWLEDESGAQVRMLAVFHDQTRIGARWLPDLRTWWRVGGRAMTMPADGISRPTQAPGRHIVGMNGLEKLPQGRYSVVVEAAREKGGRELVKVPFTLKPGAKASASANGNAELGRVAVSLRP
ncbi:MAG: DUF2271 domain-containing protein [Sphingobium sp.]